MAPNNKRSKQYESSSNSGSKSEYESNNKRLKTGNIDHGMMVNINPISNDDISDWNQWVAATATRNYMLDDGILDVLKFRGSTLTKVNKNYQDSYISTINNYNPNSFISSIMHQGVKFEKRVMKMIQEKVGQRKIRNIGGDSNPRSRTKYLDTIAAMNEGIPIIYQGILRNYHNQTYGIPDLLIRSDYLGKLFSLVPLPKAHKHKRAPKLTMKPNRKYHYVVVDIKFKTLPLKADGIHLLNDGPIKAYKSQLCIYNEALGRTQGYRPSAAFIMGWQWKYTCKNVEYRGDNCFDRLGRIDYVRSDEIYVEKTEEAIEWILNVRQNSGKWDLSKTPLPHEQLYPNMCNRYDYPYHKIKKDFAKDIDEISLVWKCGPKQRKIAHEKGIYSWKDPRCTPEALGINGVYTKKIMGRILEANHSRSQNIFPKYISNNFGDWKNNNGLEFFVDFEMTCSVFTEFDDLPYADGESLIFMIGVGYIDRGGKWVFKDFTLERLDRAGELQICNSFISYMEEIKTKYNLLEEPPLYHWSHAEPISWNQAAVRHDPISVQWGNLNWIDLLKVFQSEPIGIKGCLNYGLKDVAKTFYKYGYIHTIWDENGDCVDGADAAIGAYKVDKETRKKNLPFNQDPLAKDIIKYNEIDCKVLMEIIEYLRNHHIDPSDLDVHNCQTLNCKTQNYKNHDHETMVSESDGDGLIDYESDSIEIFSDNDSDDVIVNIREHDHNDKGKEEWDEYDSEELSDTEIDSDDYFEYDDGNYESENNFNIYEYMSDDEITKIKHLCYCNECNKVFVYDSDLLDGEEYIETCDECDNMLLHISIN